jgi:hypothetical protein
MAFDYEIASCIRYLLSTCAGCHYINTILTVYLILPRSEYFQMMHLSSQQYVP